MRLLLCFLILPLYAATSEAILTEKTGGTQTNRPFTISRMFRQGDITNYAQPVISGTPAATWQTDVINRWRDGGNVARTISSCTNATPVQCTFGSAHDFLAGDSIVIAGTGTALDGNTYKAVETSEFKILLRNSVASGAIAAGTATGPTYGSLRHALVSFKTTLTANQVVTVGFQNNTDPCSSGNQAACNAAALDQAGMLAFNGGNWSADMELTASPVGATSVVITDATAMLTAGNWSYRLRGPVVTEVIVEDLTTALAYDFGWQCTANCTSPFTSATWVAAPSATYKSIHPRFILSFYTGWVGVRAQTSLDNSWQSKEQDQKYTLQLKTGTALGTLAFDNGGAALQHTGRARWHREFWSGTTPGEVKIDRNLAYMTQAHSLPTYDLTRPCCSTATISAEVTRWGTTYPTGIMDRNVTRGGGYLKNFGSTGGRPELGWLHQIFVEWLYAMGGSGTDNRMESIMLGNSEVSGHIPIHRRDDTTGLTFDADATEQRFGKFLSYYTYRAVAYPGTSVGTRDSNSWVVDSAHQSNFAYAAWLGTGDLYWLEEAQAWGAAPNGNRCTNSSFCSGWWGYVGDTNAIRGVAWVNRNMSLAAFSSYMRTPEERVLYNWVQWQVEQREGQLNIRTGAFPPIDATCPGFVDSTHNPNEKWCWGYNIMTSGFANQASEQANLIGFNERGDGSAPDSANNLNTSAGRAQWSASSCCVTAGFMNGYYGVAMCAAKDMVPMYDSLCKGYQQFAINIIRNPLVSDPQAIAAYRWPITFQANANGAALHWAVNWAEWNSGVNYLGTLQNQSGLFIDDWTAFFNEHQGADNGYAFIHQGALGLGNSSYDVSPTIKWQDAYNWIVARNNATAPTTLDQYPKWAFAPLVPTPLPGAITNLRVIGTTPTQIIVGYTKSSAAAATFRLSEDSSFSVLANDVSNAKFSGSNADSRSSCVQVGIEVQCVLGTRSTERSSDGKTYSRALRADTVHFLEVTGPDATTATLTMKTRAPTLGNRWRDPWSWDATYPGRVLWPSLEYLTRGAEVIEPTTGITLKSWALPGDIKALFGPAALANCWQGAGWTLNSCGAVGAGGSTYAGVAQDYLALGFPSIPADGSGGWRGDFSADRWGTNTLRPRWLALTADLWFTGTDLAGADRVVDICWGRDDLGCTSPVTTVTPGTTQATFTIANASGTATTTDGEFWGAEMPDAAVTRWGTGKIYNSGSSTTVNFRAANDCKRLKTGMGLFVNTGAGIAQYAVNSTANCGAGTPSLTLTSAIDLTVPSPGPTQGWPFYANWGLVRNTAFSFLIRKHSTTASNTLHVANAKYSIGAGGIAAGSSTGEFTVCSGEQKLSAAGFMHCLDAVGRTFAINPVTGASRFLGTPVADTAGVGRAVLGTLPVLWEDANTWWASAGVPGGGASIFKATLNANAQADNPTPFISTDGGAESWWYDAAVTNMLGSSKLGDLIQTFNPTFDKTIFSCTATSYGVNRYINGVCRLGNQDTYSWPWVYDLGNKLPLGLGGTGRIIAAFPSYSSATKIAWGVVHAQHVTLDTSWAAMQNTIAKEDTTGNQKFLSLYDAYWNGSAWVAADPPHNASIRVRLTSTWNGAWGTTPATFLSGDPVSSTQSPHWLQKMAVGNQIFVNSGAEHWQITAINGQTSSGVDLTVTRKACPSTDVYETISVGQVLNPNLHCDTLDWWWDPVAGPNGEDASIRLLSLPGGGHQTDGRYFNLGTPEVGYHACDIETDASCFPMDTTNRTQIIQRSEPPFAGKTAPIFGSCHEGHPGFYPDANDAEQRALDIHPFICGYTTYTVAWISGDMFRLRTPSGYPLNRKFFVTMVGMGSGLAGKDVSSPTVAFDGTSTFAYQFCVANAANECVAGSVANDIYVNYPSFGSKSTMCSDSTITPDDLCAEDTAAEAQAVGMYVLTGLNNKTENIALYKGSEWMALAQTVGTYPSKGLANTANVKMFSGTLGWFSQYLVIVPRPLPSRDSVNRSTFGGVAVQVGSVPPGTDNALIEFGYGEFGTPSQFYCTTRQEVCTAVTAAIVEATPFYWASEAFSGLACASGCTITVPALPGHVVYYRVKYRTAGNAVIQTGQTQIAAVP